MCACPPNTQLQLITSEDNLQEEEEEEDLLITSNKQSAARTAIEQAADCTPGFKCLKKDLKTMVVPHQSTNPIVIFLKEKLEELENDNILKLKPHKKKAVMFTAPNLPSHSKNDKVSDEGLHPKHH